MGPLPCISLSGKGVSRIKQNMVVSFLERINLRFGFIRAGDWTTYIHGSFINFKNFLV